MKEYKKLDSIEFEDMEKIREYAEAMNELYSLNNRVSYLESLLEDSSELSSSIWTTMDGVSKPIADIDDGHLKNIIPYLSRSGRTNKRIVQEYQKRFGEAPALPASRIIDHEDFDF
jgi:hypothetical protein